ncbi:MAG: hypothetical protein JWQ18_943 [Conexibacter sp.]|nr:hypothetical protein [Conexibacter sp.]
MSRLATPLSVLALMGASVALVACGSSSSGSSSAGTGTTSTTAAGGNQSAAFQKFQDCLKQNGVTLPSRGQRQGGAGRGYGPPPGAGTGTNATPPAGGTGTPPAGAPGAGAGFGANNPKMAAAMKACAKLRPQGLGAGRRTGGAGAQQSIKAFTPYLTCLKAKGLDVKVSDGFNALRNLKQSDPKVQAALKSCQSKIPARPTAPRGTSTTGTT